ncbi:MAG: ASPIC/UnbV domain-containing protein [Bryobacteraceae bacterium]
MRLGKQSVYATTSGSYLSASDPRVHFGLGTSTSATAEILWPSGRRQRLENVPVDRVITVKEPQ